MRRVLAVGVGFAVLLPALAAVVMSGGLASLAGGGCPGATTVVASGPGAAANIPSGLLPLYVGAAGEYGLGAGGWAILASINYVGSDFGQDLSTSPAGAVGWMQFEPSTWATQRVTPTGTPAPNDSSGWNDPADAIYTAARYLQSSGAPGDWNGAIFAYNHAAWYVSEVDRNAAHYPSAAGGQATVDVSAIITSSTADTTSASQPPTTACAPVGSGPTVPGEVAQIQPDGTAAIPAGPPPQVQQAIAAGDRIVDTFYSQERRTSMLTHLQDSYDCSGSTDFLLYNAGLNSPKVDIGIQTAGDSLLLEQYGQSGPGQWITIYAKPGHAFIEVAGLVMDTAWYAPVRPASVPDSYPRDDPANGGPASGPRWQPASIIQAQIHGDTYGFFVKRHPPGL